MTGTFAYAACVSESNGTPDATMTPMASARGLDRAGPVAIVATLWPILGSVTVVSTAPFVAPWLKSHGSAGVACLVAALVVLGAIAFAPTVATSAVAGWAFGFRVGFPAVLVGTLLGATLCYATARRLAGRQVAATFAEHPRWEAVRRSLVEASRWKTLWLVTLLRLSPVLPFGTTNVLLATTRVRPPVYVAGTLLGLAPRVGLIVLAAAGTERLDLSAAESWPLFVGGIAATALCIVVFAIAGKRALDRATRSTDAVPDHASA
jgi:uncharacterized membrane protein YdjX (TVP38/TMEM64 family)